MKLTRRWISMMVIAFSGGIIFVLPFLFEVYYRPMIDAFGLTNTELGRFMSTFGFVSMLAYFPGGWIADRVSPRLLMTVSLLATGAAGFYFSTIEREVAICWPALQCSKSFFVATIATIITCTMYFMDRPFGSKGFAAANIFMDQSTGSHTARVIVFHASNIASKVKLASVISGAPFFRLGVDDLRNGPVSASAEILRGLSLLLTHA